nr:rubredoxin [Beggiatoa alba]
MPESKVTPQTDNKNDEAYICLACGFVYKEAIGIPNAGIPAGTAWADMPSDWVCPVCGVMKTEFEKVIKS